MTQMCKGFSPHSGGHKFKAAPRLTTACTRPPTRRLSSTSNRSGRRVMPGVMPLLTVNSWRISKYNPAFRDERGAYLKDDRRFACGSRLEPTHGSSPKPLPGRPIAPRVCRRPPTSRARSASKSRPRRRDDHSCRGAVRGARLHASSGRRRGRSTPSRRRRG